jgi:hypothetical protein
LLLNAGGGQGSGRFQGDSEAEVFVRHAESFLGRTVTTFAADRLPALLLAAQAACVQLAAASAAAAAAAAAPQPQVAAAVGAALAPAAPALQGADACLRLLARCGPSLPLRGVAGAPDELAPDADVSGAHGAAVLGALCQLADGWAACVGTVAAAAQPAGEPRTPPPLAAEAAAGLAAWLAAGGRLYKAAGSLTATWLSRLVLGLAHGTVDPDCGTIARRLLHSHLHSCATLLRAAAAAPAEGGWRGALAPAAVWAGEALVAATSVALSSSLKPPATLLQGLLDDPAQASCSCSPASASLHPAAVLMYCPACGCCCACCPACCCTATSAAYSRRRCSDAAALMLCSRGTPSRRVLAAALRRARCQGRR